MTGVNVLLTTAGRKSYLAHIFKASPRAGRVVAIDSDPLSPIRHVADRFEVAPPVERGEAFLEFLHALCREHSIDCVLPQNDRELTLLAGAREEFRKDGTRIAGLPRALVEIVCDKYALDEWLRERGYLHPKTWLRYPKTEVGRLVEKDRFGQGSQGLAHHDVAPDAMLPEGKVVQEHVDGEEYNLDILRDAAGTTVAVSVKRKLLMLHGSTDRAVSDASPQLKALGARLADDLDVFGSIDVDLILSDGEPYLLDVNPRIGGGFPFTAEYFPGYVDALLEVCAGREIGALGEEYQPGVVVCREATYSAGGRPARRLPRPMEKST